MNVHNNARLTPKGREAMARAVVDDGGSYAEVARIFHSTPKTVAKWSGRYRELGLDGLRDRSSRPHECQAKRPSPLVTTSNGCADNATRHAESVHCTMDQISAETDLSRATVSRILKRAGLSLLACLEPKPPRPRYERETPGEIIHTDIKKLGRSTRLATA